ncbi:DUF445 domain-containing protein [Acetonema longum]|uniref:DUF445 domain-containing protein n=1 Tax=Acetonema longum DSM 6540 TaxID=1009370 RepID=F7NFZ3_9FIRM|nr:DUF445 domain-containing protein [Acetonema longum]EGO65056.1 hypothetical protein ALO_04883 [Acetonema longum DSM 6540]
MSGKMLNQYKATAVLGVATAGYLVSLPCQHSFFGGLMASGFGAAMVGGLADWFAVSALFRRPLGIPWRTAVIPRQRRRLFDMIVQMVQAELLTKENIKRKLAEQDMPRIILTYLEERGGARLVKRMIHKLLLDILAKMDSQETGRVLGILLQREAGRIRLAPVLAQVCEWSLANGYDQRAAKYVLDELKTIVARPEMRILLTSVLREALIAYEGEKAMRQIAAALANITPERLAELAQNKLSDWLEELKQPEHPLRQRLRDRMISLAAALRTDPAVQAKLSEWQERMMARVDLAPLAARLVRDMQQRAASHPQDAVRWLKDIDEQLDRLMDCFRQDRQQQDRIGEWIRNVLEEFIDLYHKKLGNLVQARLDQFSNRDLVEFIEGRVGNDLQMIRINGSVVGGLAGMTVYLLTYWI